MTFPAWAGLLLATVIMWTVLMDWPLKHSSAWSNSLTMLYRVVAGIMLTLIVWLIYFMVM